jgi:hypothetical protein
MENVLSLNIWEFKLYLAIDKGMPEQEALFFYLEQITH